MAGDFVTSFGPGAVLPASDLFDAPFAGEIGSRHRKAVEPVGPAELSKRLPNPRRSHDLARVRKCPFDRSCHAEFTDVLWSKRFDPLERAAQEPVKLLKS